MGKRKPDAERKGPAKTDRFGGTLYPDATNYDCESVLQSLDTHFEEWAYILHDMDVNPDTGELKKPHYHWVGKQKSSGLVSTVANKLQIPEHDIEMIDTWKGAVQYLTHINYPEKYQYQVEAITANFDLTRFFRNMSMNAKAARIGTEILEHRVTSMTGLYQWCIAHNCYDELRRGISLWSMLLREANADA